MHSFFVVFIELGRFIGNKDCQRLAVAAQADDVLFHFDLRRFFIPVIERSSGAIFFGIKYVALYLVEGGGVRVGWKRGVLGEAVVTCPYV